MPYHSPLWKGSVQGFNSIYGTNTNEWTSHLRLFLFDLVISMVEFHGQGCYFGS